MRVNISSMLYYCGKKAVSQVKNTNPPEKKLLPENRKLLQDINLSLRDALDWDDFKKNNGTRSR